MPRFILSVVTAIALLMPGPVVLAGVAEGTGPATCNCLSVPIPLTKCHTSSVLVEVGTKTRVEGFGPGFKASGGSSTKVQVSIGVSDCVGPFDIPAGKCVYFQYLFGCYKIPVRGVFGISWKTVWYLVSYSIVERDTAPWDCP